MLFSSRESGSWPWAVLGVGACVLVIAAPMCAHADTNLWAEQHSRSVVFVLDTSGPPPAVAKDDGTIAGTYDVYDGVDKTEFVLVVSGDDSAVDWTLKGTPYSGRLKNPSASGNVSAGTVWGGDFPVPGQGYPGIAAMWVKPDENTQYRASELKLRDVRGGGWTWQYRLQRRGGTDEQDADDDGDENGIPGTYDVYDDVGKTEFVLVLSGDDSPVDWTLKGTPYSGRVATGVMASAFGAGRFLMGDFSIPGQENPAYAEIWLTGDKDHWRPHELRLEEVKGSPTSRKWTYRLQKPGEPDGQDGGLEARQAFLTDAIELMVAANLRLGAKWEWAVITLGAHEAHLRQPFTSAIDKTSLEFWKFDTMGDRPLVWAVTQAMAYLYKYGRRPVGQIVVISGGMDLCDERSPGGGAQAVRDLNDALFTLKLPRRSPSTGGGARRSQRFGAVELFPIDLGLLRQGRPGEVLGAAGETIDDVLPRVKALIEGSDKQVTVSVVTTRPTLDEQDSAALRSIAEAGGGHYSSAATPDDIADVMSQVIGLPDPDAPATPSTPDPTPADPGGEQPVPDAPDEWTTHTDDAQGITMQIAPGWAVGKGLDEVVLEVRRPGADGEKHEGALVRLATDEGGTLDDFIAQAGQWTNDQVGRECEMQRGATLQCPEGDVATLRFTDPESPESYLLAFVTLGKHNGYILGFQGPRADEKSVRADLEKMAESMQVP